VSQVFRLLIWSLCRFMQLKSRKTWLGGVAIACPSHADLCLLFLLVLWSVIIDGTNLHATKLAKTTLGFGRRLCNLFVLRENFFCGSHIWLWLQKVNLIPARLFFFHHSLPFSRLNSWHTTCNHQPPSLHHQKEQKFFFKNFCSFWCQI